MNLTELLLRALETTAQDDRVRFMAEVGRLIVRQVHALGMWEVENGPRYFGFEDRHWSDIYLSDFEGNLHQYAAAEPTTDFFLGSSEPDQSVRETDGGEAPAPQGRRFRFEEAFGEGGRLGAMARQGDDIGGYLATMVRNYLHERQKSKDLVGYRVFKNLEAVMEELEAANTLSVTGRVGRRQRIRPSSIIRFRATNAEGGAPASLAETVLEAPTLAGNVHKLAKLGRGAQRLLLPAVEGRPAVGFSEFPFGELLAPLQQRVREAARVWFSEPPASRGIETGGAKNLEEIRIVDPAERYTLGEYLELLAREVRAEIDRVVPQERTRLGLRGVLDDWFAHLAETQADGDDHPSLDEWAIRLGLKRSTLWDYIQRLREIIARVKAARDGNGS